MPKRPELPSEIKILKVALGGRGSGSGGRYVTADATVTAHIEGIGGEPPDEFFKVSQVETWGLVFEPDVHPPRQVWERVLKVDGPGPIEVEAGEAILVYVGFSLPSQPPDPEKATYRATAVIQGDGLLNSVRLPILATPSTVAGLVVDVLTNPPILPGQTENFTFRISSSIPHPVGPVDFVYDSQFEPRFSAPTQTLTVPGGNFEQNGIVDITVPLTCAPGTPVKDYGVFFILRASDKSRTFDEVEPIITVIRSLEVVTSLPNDLKLQQGDPVTCAIRVTLTGEPAMFSVFHTRLPAGISVSDVPSITVDGTGFVGLSIDVDPKAPLGKLEPLIIFWAVNNSERTGQFIFDIEVFPVFKQFLLSPLPLSSGKVDAQEAVVSMFSDGRWQFKGRLHDNSDLFGDKVIFTFAANEYQGGVNGVMGAFQVELGASATSPPETASFVIPRVGQYVQSNFLANNWQQVFAKEVTFRLEVSPDLGQLFSDMGDAILKFFKNVFNSPVDPCVVVTGDDSGNISGGITNTSGTGNCPAVTIISGPEPPEDPAPPDLFATVRNTLFFRT